MAHFGGVCWLKKQMSISLHAQMYKENEHLYILLFKISLHHSCFKKKFLIFVAKKLLSSLFEIQIQSLGSTAINCLLFISFMKKKKA